MIQGLCIFVDAEGYWKTQKVPGSLEDDFNFPLIWIDKHLTFEFKRRGRGDVGARSLIRFIVCLYFIIGNKFNVEHFDGNYFHTVN